MIIEVVKEFSFDSAHFLPDYDGKCKNVHGHRWVLGVGFAGEVNPKTGMVIDFVDMKQTVNELIIDRLDHVLLNELDIPHTDFPKYNPTAENMVKWMVRILKISAHHYQGCILSFVRLYESPQSYVEWRAEER